MYLHAPLHIQPGSTALTASCQDPQKVPEDFCRKAGGTDVICKHCWVASTSGPSELEDTSARSYDILMQLSCGMMLLQQP